MSVHSEVPDVAVEPRSPRAVDGAGGRDLSDSDLLALISRGDLGALGVIYDNHIEVVWRVALHFSAGAAAVEQAVAAVFLSLWRNPEGNDQTSLRARLLTSVIREARDSRQPVRGLRMRTRSELHKRPLMVVANEAIDRLHRSFDLADSDFFCECGDIRCKERITLSRAEYAELREESRALIAPAHADHENAAVELHDLRGQVHQLQGALASRVNIEQAKGVLVERHGMTPIDAFEALRQRARDQHRSLDEVCADIIAWAGIPKGERSAPAPISASRPNRATP